MDMYNVIQLAMQCANKKQVKEYYETTKLMSLEKYTVDSGLGDIAILPTVLEHTLRKIGSKMITIKGLIMIAMVDCAVTQHLANYYASMTSSKTVISFLKESGAGGIEVNRMKLIKAINLLRRSSNE